jgi:hypothetical protein
LPSRAGSSSVAQIRRTPTDCRDTSKGQDVGGDLVNIDPDDFDRGQPERHPNPSVNPPGNARYSRNFPLKPGKSAVSPLHDEQQLIKRDFDLRLAYAAVEYADHRFLELTRIPGDLVVTENAGDACRAERSGCISKYACKSRPSKRQAGPNSVGRSQANHAPVRPREFPLLTPQRWPEPV